MKGSPLMLVWNLRRFIPLQQFSRLLLAAICFALVMLRTGRGLAAVSWSDGWRAVERDRPADHLGGPKNENILWTADLLGDGIASPVVWKDRLFVVNASRKADDKKIGREYPEQYVACYETRQGSCSGIPWFRQAPGCEPEQPSRRGFAMARRRPTANAFTPSSARRSSVARLHRQTRLAARTGAAPLRHGDGHQPDRLRKLRHRLLRHAGGSRLVAFDRRTGAIVWDKDLKDTGYGHNTPLIIQVKGSPQLILMGAGLGPAKNAIQGFDPRTGERLWWSRAGRNRLRRAGESFVFCDSGRGGAAKLVDPSGAGNVSDTHVKWEANVASGLSSPLVVGGHIYRLHDNHTLTCWEIATGKKVYQERVEGITSNWASPVADAKGRIFLASGGISAVVEAGPEFKVLATNKLGDANHACPTVAGGRLYLLGDKRLYAIGKK